MKSNIFVFIMVGVYLCFVCFVHVASVIEGFNAATDIMYDEIHTLLVTKSLTGNKALTITKGIKDDFKYYYTDFGDVIQFDKRRFITSMKNAARISKKKLTGGKVDHNDVPDE